MQRRTVISLLLLALVELPHLSAAAEAGAIDWDHVYVDGGPVEDGMLLPGRLVVEFAAGATPGEALARSADGTRDA